MIFSAKKFRILRVLATALPAVCLFSAVSHASAQRISKIDGAKLAELCKNPKQVPICGAYLSGVMDSEVWAGKYDEKIMKQPLPAAFCIPPSQKLTQIRGVVSAWLGAHSEAAKMPAGKAIYLALHSSYPCKPSEETQPAKSE